MRNRNKTKYKRDDATAELPSFTLGERAYVSMDIPVGALRSPYKADDYIFERLAFGPDTVDNVVPPSVDLRPYSRPSRDQLKRGTCAAFAATAIKEIHDHVRIANDAGTNTTATTTLSPEFLYYHRENRPAEGMYGRNVFQILRDIGTVPEEMFPYSHDGSMIPRVTTAMYDVAGSYRINNFARVLTCNGLKRALREAGPCYMVLPLYPTRPHFWRRSKKRNIAEGGGHSVAVVGYNDRGFILKNSWGPTWNGDGCVVFPYGDWDSHWECWVPINRDIVDIGTRSTSRILVNTVDTIIPMEELKITPLNVSLEMDETVARKNKCFIL